MRLGVIGLGHVGLCLAGFLARKFKVIGMDIDRHKLELLERSKLPFYEPGLEQLLNRVSSRLEYTSELEHAVLESDAIFICLPTREFEPLLELAQQLSPMISGKLVVIRSTLLPGITRRFWANLIASGANPEDLLLCFNPEFLSEGKALPELYRPSRLIIGELNPKSGQKLLQIYAELYGARLKWIPVIRCSLEEAELIKYANNAFLALKISFINLIADLCELLKLDVGTIADGIGLDPRIGRAFLNAGLGYGGSCLPINLEQLIRFMEQAGLDPSLLRAAQLINSQRYLKPIALAESVLGNLKNRKIALLGAAFKPNTDDLRDAVSIKIIQELLRKGAQVKVHDPVALDKLRMMFGDQIQCCSSISECLSDAEFCILVTEWDQYKHLSPEDFCVMRFPWIYDGRRALDPNQFPSNYLRLGTGR